jgi:hypothetical protein
MSFCLLDAVDNTRALLNLRSNHIAPICGVQPPNIPVQNGPASIAVGIHNNGLQSEESPPSFKPG